MLIMLSVIQKEKSPHYGIEILHVWVVRSGQGIFAWRVIAINFRLESAVSSGVG